MSQFPRGGDHLLPRYQYYWRLWAGASALPFMKVTYSATLQQPAIRLPPEILELIFMHCTEGLLDGNEMRCLYPAAVLLGCRGLTNREVVHGAVMSNLSVLLNLDC